MNTLADRYFKMSLNVDTKDQEILKYFASYIEKEVGIIYADHNAFQLRNRLEEIAKLTGETSIGALYLTAQKGIAGAFKQMLLELLLLTFPAQPVTSPDISTWISRVQSAMNN